MPPDEKNKGTGLPFCHISTRDSYKLDINISLTKEVGHLTSTEGRTQAISITPQDANVVLGSPAPENEASQQA